MGNLGDPPQRKKDACWDMYNIISVTEGSECFSLKRPLKY